MTTGHLPTGCKTTGHLTADPVTAEADQITKAGCWAAGGAGWSGTRLPSSRASW